MKKLIVQKSKLIKNIDIIKSMTEARIIAVLKGNGYGLGLVEFGRLLLENAIDFFAVTTLEEALILRQNGFDNPVLLLTPPSTAEEGSAIVDNSILPSIGSIYSAALLNEAAKSKGILLDAHLKLDTGFGRFGFLWNEIKDYTGPLKAMENINITGTYSHLSYSFEKKPRIMHLQFDRFFKAVEVLEAEGINPGIKHIANSCAFLRYPSMHLDAARIGSAFLGRIPIGNPYGLEKIGYMKSSIIDVKDLPKDYSIGYANTYRTKTKSLIGIIPVGYKDGFGVEKSRDTFRFIDILRYIYNDLKLLNGQLHVRLGDRTQLRILGRISMFNIVVDLTETQASIGDEVILEINPLFVENSIEREYI